MRMKTRLAVLLLVLSIAYSALGSGTMTTVILVRHAEKSPDATLTDPPLTAAGEARAKTLARMLGKAGVSAIYTTPVVRTRRTAAPLAAALGVQPVEIQTGATYANDVVSRIRNQHAGATVLVVGHSNTTPEVIRALGIAEAPAIPDAEFDNFFVVTFVDGHAPSLLKLKY